MKFISHKLVLHKRYLIALSIQDVDFKFNKSMVWELKAVSKFQKKE
jgi:hypothetical protein